MICSYLHETNERFSVPVTFTSLADPKEESILLFKKKKMKNSYRMFVKIHAYIFKVEYLQRPYCLIGL